LTDNLSSDIVHSMNDNSGGSQTQVTRAQLQQFSDLIARLYRCCQERMQVQSERFRLPDAELRCLMLFGEERYLTPKGIALRMKLAKSRVSRLIDGLGRKKLILRIKDPEDSRVSLLSLTPEGQKKLQEVNKFLEETHFKVLVQMAPDQRQIVLTNLEILKASMESMKEMM
jgi:DNA-binding MarR family transcriptional regulator